MPRSAALTPEQVPPDSKPTLDAFTKNIGFTPNMMATFAASPIAFNAWATFFGSLSKVLDVKTRDSIGLAVSEVNGCNYCLTVHSFTAEHMAKLPTDEIMLARKGYASDPKRDAAIQFARRIIETRGKVSDADVRAVRDAGYTDANLIEIVALVAMYSLTNFFNNVFDPEKDFPAVAPANSVASAHDGGAQTVTKNFEAVIPNIPGKSLVALEVDYAPGAASPSHTHAKSAFIYAHVISGAIESKVNDGQTRIYRPGESWSEAPGAIHSISRNASKTEPAKLLAVFVLDTNDKALTRPIK